MARARCVSTWLRRAALTDVQHALVLPRHGGAAGDGLRPSSLGRRRRGGRMAASGRSPCKLSLLSAGLCGWRLCVPHARRGASGVAERALRYGSRPQGRAGVARRQRALPAGPVDTVSAWAQGRLAAGNRVKTERPGCPVCAGVCLDGMAVLAELWAGKCGQGNCTRSTGPELPLLRGSSRLTAQAQTPHGPGPSQGHCSAQVGPRRIARMADDVQVLVKFVTKLPAQLRVPETPVVSGAGRAGAAERRRAPLRPLQPACTIRKPRCTGHTCS
jgi:hypothetical protein